MRRTEREIKDKNVINEILSTALICRLAFTGDEYPYIVPLNFGYHNNALYFHCALNGKKIELLKQNNKVCFEIEKSHEIIPDDVSCKWTTKYQSIIGYGEIEIISDTDEKKKGLDILMIQHGKKENKYNDKLLEKIKVLKLQIKSLTAKQSL